MKNFVILIFVLSLSAFTSSVHEKFTLHGTVTDASGNGLPGVQVKVKGSNSLITTDLNGKFSILTEKGEKLIFSKAGFQERVIEVTSAQHLYVVMKSETDQLQEVISAAHEKAMQHEQIGHPAPGSSNMLHTRNMGAMPQTYNTEEYDHITENRFMSPLSSPLSTFSLDVDGASYSNVRRVINSGSIPDPNMVRIEEMINYFDYNYPIPDSETPFSVITEVGAAPWNTQHKLVHIGIQGKKMDPDEQVASNLVFLIDVSGSMNAPNKLELLKKSMMVLVDGLKDTDKVSIVTYAGAAGLVLDVTSAAEKGVIFSALERLQAGGSTAGGQGIELAYQVAKENLIRGGNNRIILATDGDFNVGTSSTGALVDLIEEKRKEGIYLTITGFGMGNYKDGRMEQISNAGNGNYYYIDTFKEAVKVFGSELQGTLFTIASDVKVQVEFNPAKIQAYRLVGYENRKLNDEDLNDDKVDAGELGAGHTMTALYEIIPAGVDSEFTPIVDNLKYKYNRGNTVATTDEWMTVKLRYKPINGENTNSRLIEHVVSGQAEEGTSDNFRFSASVASFGMILRDSEYRQQASLQDVLQLAKSATGDDEYGYRNEFITLVSTYAATVSINPKQ